MKSIAAVYIIITIVVLLLIASIVLIIVFIRRKQHLTLQQHRLKEAGLEKEVLLQKIESQQLLIEERNRISRDMHDDLGAGLSALRLHLELINKKIEAGATINEDIDDLLASTDSLHLSMREMLWNLNSTHLDTGSFSDYAARYTREFLGKAPIQTEIGKHRHAPACTLSPEATRHLLMCLKEGLNNILKHSRADRVTLSFTHTPGLFEIQLKDNGVGVTGASSRGMGIRNIRERMAAIGGMAEWSSSADGCLLVLRVEC